MKTSFILLFKGALGGGAAGFGALLFFAAFYLIYRRCEHGDFGCFGYLLLPLLPIVGIFSALDKVDTKAVELDMKTIGKEQFDLPPSLLLKVLVALSGIGLWIMGFILMGTYDVSKWWVAFWSFMPLAYINLYLLWLKVFFVWLGKLRKPVAVIITIFSVILIIVFWIFAIKACNYYTSIEYLRQYWERKYGVL